MATAFRPVRTTKDRLDIEKYNEVNEEWFPVAGQLVADKILFYFKDKDEISVEEIQDAVEKELMFFISTLVPSLSSSSFFIETLTSTLIWPRSALASLTSKYKNIFLSASQQAIASFEEPIQGSVTVSRSGTPALL